MEPEVIDISKEMSRFKTLMSEKGYKSTPQRDELTEWIFSVHDHFTVEDVVASFRKVGKRVAPATVYRVINLLLELGLILQHDFGKGYKYYEHSFGHQHHDHMICLDCDKIFEFYDEKIEKMQDKICGDKGFTIKDHNLRIFVSCNNQSCENRKSRNIN